MTKFGVLSDEHSQMIDRSIRLSEGPAEISGCKRQLVPRAWSHHSLASKARSSGRGLLASC